MQYIYLVFTRPWAENPILMHATTSRTPICSPPSGRFDHENGTLTCSLSLTLQRHSRAMVSNSTPSAIVPMVLDNVFGLTMARFAYLGTIVTTRSERPRDGRRSASCSKPRWRIFHRVGLLSRVSRVVFDHFSVESVQKRHADDIRKQRLAPQPTKIRAEAHLSLDPTTAPTPLYQPKRDAKMVSFFTADGGLSLGRIPDSEIWTASSFLSSVSWR